MNLGAELLERLEERSSKSLVLPSKYLGHGDYYLGQIHVLRQ